MTALRIDFGAIPRSVRLCLDGVKAHDDASDHGEFGACAGYRRCPAMPARVSRIRQFTTHGGGQAHGNGGATCDSHAPTRPAADRPPAQALARRRSLGSPPTAFSRVGWVIQAILALRDVGELASPASAGS